MEYVSLQELLYMVRQSIEVCCPDSYWVTGELSEARVASNGHFYGELVERNEDGTHVLARARVNCWASTYNRILYRFQAESGQTIRSGLNVLLRVQVSFHEIYGFSLNILDIDASYTMGNLLRKRKEILARLEADSILHDNQLLPMPLSTQRIAIISASTAAGYGDFCHHLLHNEYKLRFQTKLFPATMQGEYVEESVLAALQQIAQETEAWDVVVVIRGGGASADFSYFESYLLAACIAQFPLPVIVGIGHERDTTVLDYVAHTSVKTPTAAADLLINHQWECYSNVLQFTTRIQESVNKILDSQQRRLQQVTYQIPMSAQKYLQGYERRIAQNQHRVTVAVTKGLQSQSFQLQKMLHALYVGIETLMTHRKHTLEMLIQRVELNDPSYLMKRGYSYVVCDGHLLTDASAIQPGSVLHTTLARGEIVSVCKEIITEISHEEEFDI